ncbi:MAG: pyridoxal-phosphate dependent enzyme [bacterium]|nr:pyridoxal-phosphate dependent enzyme [bacterium]
MKSWRICFDTRGQDHNVIHENALQAIGWTPLVRLARIHPPGNLVAKLDYLNPAGSVKERIAVNMIDQAERAGSLRPGGTIIEPTSGNTGAGLAMVGAVRGYRVICTVPDKVATEKIRLLEAYGAEVIVTPTNLTPDHEDSYYGVARRLTEEIDGAYSPDQYSNPYNPQAHYLTTGPELWEQTNGEIDAFVAGVGTGGTISGTGKYLRERKPSVALVGADPEGSIYTAAREEDIHQYRVEGVGEDFWPETLDQDIVDRYIMVDDQQSFDMARRVAEQEGLLIGGSGGMAVHAALEVAEADPDRLVVVLLPDSGRGYLTKIWNQDWLTEHGLR